MITNTFFNEHSSIFDFNMFDCHSLHVCKNQGVVQLSNHFCTYTYTYTQRITHANVDVNIYTKQTHTGKHLTSWKQCYSCVTSFNPYAMLWIIPLQCKMNLSLSPFLLIKKQFHWHNVRRTGSDTTKWNGIFSLTPQ